MSTIEPEASRAARRRRQIRGLFGLTAARGGAAVVSGVWLIVVAHELTLTQFGDLSILLALGSIFINISDAGLQVMIGDHVARAGVISRRVVIEGIARRLVYAAVCAVAVIALYLAAAADSNPIVPVLFAGSVLGTAVYQIVLAAYRARGMVAVDAANEIFSRVGVLVVGTALVLAGGRLVAAAAVYPAADLLSAAAVTWYIARRYFVSDDRLPKPDLRLRSTASLAVAITIWLVYLRVDGYLVGLLAGSDAAGIYAAAYRFLDFAMLPALVLSHTVLAHVAPLRGRERLAEVHRFLVQSVVISVPIAVVGSLVVGPAIRILFPPTFAAAGGVAVILLLSSVPGAAAATLVPLAGVADRRLFAAVAIGALVLNVGINLAVIPTYGATGAAWATVISQLFLAVSLYPLIRRRAALEEPLETHADVEDASW